jgi:hypothetical protein
MFGGPRTLLETLVRETVVLHLEGDESIKGVLMASHADCFVLEHAASLYSGGSTPVDGQAIVPRAKVRWAQRLSTEEVTP